MCSEVTVNQGKGLRAQGAQGVPLVGGHSLVDAELLARLHQVVGQLLHHFRVAARVDGRRAERQVRVRVHSDGLLSMLLTHILQDLLEGGEGGGKTGGWGLGLGFSRAGGKCDLRREGRLGMLLTRKIQNLQQKRWWGGRLGLTGSGSTHTVQPIHNP